MQKLVDVVGEMAAFGDDLTGKQRFGEDGESQLGHIDGDVENLRRPLPASSYLRT